MRKGFKLLLSLLLGTPAWAQIIQNVTYCNPLNIDYTYMIYNANEGLSYRSGADPAVVQFRGEYYMFVTRSLGYWHSKDMTNWDFITPEKWYFQGSNAPAAHNYKDSVLYVAGDPSGSMSVLYTDNPKKGDWKATPFILNDLQDPDLFIDDDGKAYMFWGSSNLYPVRGRELDRNNNFKPAKEIHELFNLDGNKHGWERFGENHTSKEKGYVEGPWMTKHNNKYYLQYAAPGTEFNVYGDGVYVSDHPLGPYTYAPNNPVSYKPGGYINGAGHGSTVLGPGNQYWHFASMAVSVNVNWERRLCAFPAGFDADGLMYTNTAYGDYPHYAAAAPDKAGAFTGWMLLSYKKPVTSSSIRASAYSADMAVDENVKTFWLADKNDDHQWLQIDMQKPAAVYAVQINYSDYQANLYGRVPGLYHRYTVEGSNDGKTWVTLINKKDSFADTPNDYVQLEKPVTVRYIRYNNVHVPANLAISGFRVFGKGRGVAPKTPAGFKVNRAADRRDAMLTWAAVKGSQGYNIRWGIAPNKLYNSWLVYDANQLDLKSLSTDQMYYFTVEAFNENGVSQATTPLKVK
ncbi:family 43 glycosylhydrolase [Mucilaginibacter sp. Bleaf8]|uniref:family 43 glycosylhydrolase n=1 Tax=Mucilaginibacter sp. Bleaf8 TaxID=2834430 RepID=UPI001BCCD8D6|nr:family 43 glycosylhydrolase [Mucilaginibacter sp. Bleaf8]MBS7565748.1 family 43 glycosylhydrolase [Mucilaginibacter sp. Bleaf8]